MFLNREFTVFPSAIDEVVARNARQLADLSSNLWTYYAIRIQSLSCSWWKTRLTDILSLNEWILILNVFLSHLLKWCIFVHTFVQQVLTTIYGLIVKKRVTIFLSMLLPPSWHVSRQFCNSFLCIIHFTSAGCKL